jgi:hypothetical protein
VRVSPDGKHVAYTHDESGATDIYIAEFPGFTVKRKVSSNGGFFPVWAPGGKEILYRALDGWLMTAEVRTSPSLTVGAPQRLFAFGTGPFGNAFAVSPDGKRFVIADFIAPPDAQSAINLLLNWPAAIR